MGLLGDMLHQKRQNEEFQRQRTHDTNLGILQSQEPWVTQEMKENALHQMVNEAAPTKQHANAILPIFQSLLLGPAGMLMSRMGGGGRNATIPRTTTQPGASPINIAQQRAVGGGMGGMGGGTGIGATGGGTGGGGFTPTPVVGEDFAYPGAHVDSTSVLDDYGPAQMAAPVGPTGSPRIGGDVLPGIGTAGAGTGGGMGGGSLVNPTQAEGGEAPQQTPSAASTKAPVSYMPHPYKNQGKGLEAMYTKEEADEAWMNRMRALQPFQIEQTLKQEQAEHDIQLKFAEQERQRRLTSIHGAPGWANIPPDDQFLIEQQAKDVPIAPSLLTYMHPSLLAKKALDRNSGQMVDVQVHPKKPGVIFVDGVQTDEPQRYIVGASDAQAKQYQYRMAWAQRNNTTVDKMTPQQNFQADQEGQFSTGEMGQLVNANNILQAPPGTYPPGMVAAARQRVAEYNMAQAAKASGIQFRGFQMDPTNPAFINPVPVPGGPGRTPSAAPPTAPPSGPASAAPTAQTRSTLPTGIPGASAAAPAGPPAAAPSRLGDFTKTGDDFLDSIPDPARRNDVAMMANYEMLPPSGMGAMRGLGLQMISQAKAANPSYDPSLAPDIVKTWAAYFGNPSPNSPAANVNSMNTVVGHVETLQHLASALQNGNFQALNEFVNWYRAKKGDPRITNFEVAKTAVVDELARVFKASGVTNDAIDQWKVQFQNYLSQRQMDGAVQVTGELLGNRLGVLRNGYEAGTMGYKPMNLVRGSARTALQYLGVDVDKLDPIPEPGTPLDVPQEVIQGLMSKGLKEGGVMPVHPPNAREFNVTMFHGKLYKLPRYGRQRTDVYR